MANDQRPDLAVGVGVQEFGQAVGIQKSVTVQYRLGQRASHFEAQDEGDKRCVAVPTNQFEYF